MEINIVERFWSKVDRCAPSECWLWKPKVRQGRKYGYGKFAVGHRRTALAHRVSYEIAVGKIPGGLCVLHKCDVRNCVNPTHLFLGTRADNNADRDAKGRHRPGAARGEAHWKAKLTWNGVREIRSDKSSTVRVLAAKYGVSATAISLIKRNLAWIEK